jgi:hypothetical protein
MTTKTVQMLALVAVFLAVYSGRVVRGSAKETAEGIEFGMKPMVTYARLLALPIYFVALFYPLWTQHKLPVWVPVLIVALAALILFQMPGTIVLTPDAVIQKFWLRGTKRIQYNEVMAMQASGGGRMTRVLGDNRVNITHTWNHADTDRFREEITKRTGRKLS